MRGRMSPGDYAGGNGGAVGVWRTPEAGLDRRTATMHIAGNAITGGFAREWLAAHGRRGRMD